MLATKNIQVFKLKISVWPDDCLHLGIDFLVVTHGGFIMEFTNAINWLKDNTFQDKFNNNAKNTSIWIYTLTQDLASAEPDKIEYSIALLNYNEHVNMTMAQLNTKYGNAGKKSTTVVYKSDKQKAAVKQLAALAKSGLLVRKKKDAAPEKK